MSEQNKILFAQLVCCAKISQKFSRVFHSPTQYEVLLWYLGG